MEKNRQRKTLKGVVISNKMDKTATIKVVRKIRHPKYEKLVERWKKYYAHDENNQAQVGQEVMIEETRPLSKTKRWRILAEQRATEQ